MYYRFSLDFKIIQAANIHGCAEFLHDPSAYPYPSSLAQRYGFPRSTRHPVRQPSLSLVTFRAFDEPGFTSTSERLEPQGSVKLRNRKDGSEGEDSGFSAHYAPLLEFHNPHGPGRLSSRANLFHHLLCRDSSQAHAYDGTSIGVEGPGYAISTLVFLSGQYVYMTRMDVLYDESMSQGINQALLFGQNLLFPSLIHPHFRFTLLSISLYHPYACRTSNPTSLHSRSTSTPLVSRRNIAIRRRVNPAGTGTKALKSHLFFHSVSSTLYPSFRYPSYRLPSFTGDRVQTLACRVSL